jgi:hypothetical protein
MCCQSGGTAQFVGFFWGLQEVVVRNHVDGASFITRRKEEEII